MTYIDTIAMAERETRITWADGSGVISYFGHPDLCVANDCAEPPVWFSSFDIDGRNHWHSVTWACHDHSGLCPSWVSGPCGATSRLRNRSDYERAKRGYSAGAAVQYGAQVVA